MDGIGDQLSFACVALKSAFIATSSGRICRPMREMAWRENNRRVSNGEQYLMTTSAALTHPVSRQWKGYWQRVAK